MKGIMIYEAPFWADEENAVYTQEVINASYTLDAVGCTDITCHLEGTATKDPITKAKCSKDDTYDFETGALISLMKTCGLEKSAKAYAEIFDDTAYGDALIERDKLKEEVKSLKAAIHAKKVLNAKLLKDYNSAQSAYEVMVEKSADLREALKMWEDKYQDLKAKNKNLEEENKRLKAEKDLSWKNYQRKIQKKQDRINELETQITASEDDKQKNIEYYEKEIKRLNNVSEGFYKFNNRLIGEIDQKNHEITSLKEKIEKIKLDCEKLQHGYNDTDMIFCGGRQNGKQYTLLVDLFKKIDQKKVDAAYKEAYNTTLPVWQKEALRQAYEIRKESKEKTVWLTSQSFTRDYLDSLLESSKYAIPYTTEWIKPPTKREEMWGEVLALHKKSNVIIVVEKKDVDAFLHEIEKRIPEIRWASWQKIFEAKGTIKDIYEALKTCDRIYFRLRKENELSYSSDPDIYQYRDLKHISYLPPMRWDLFKKGRRIVRVTPDNLDDFMTKCSNEISGMMKRNLKRYKEFTHLFIRISDYHYDNRPTVHIMTPEDLVRNQHENPKKYNDKKIVDWEDAR